MSSDDVANFRNQLSQGPDFKPASLFAYQKIDLKLFELQFLRGFTVQLSDPIQQATFDRANGEGLFAKAFSQGLNDNKELQFTPPATLTLQGKIGEVSAGWRSQGKVENIPMNCDRALFRRGQIGVVMATIYLDGAKPTQDLRTPTKKPGFLPNLPITTKSFREKPGFWTPCVSPTTITISEAGRKFDSRMMELRPDLTQPQ